MSKERAKRSRKIANPVVLVVLDGWGIAEASKHNAISNAKTPNLDRMREKYGAIEICASGECVGLTPGQMGNSEVGHLTIGAGRIIFQDLMRVHDEIESGRLAKNKTLTSALRSIKKRKNATVHFLGLLSDGGVHSHIQHLFALLDIAKSQGAEKVRVHVFLDGRDTPPRSGAGHVTSLENKLKTLSMGEIASMAGRFYAMDRDARWDRTKLAYDAIMYGKAERHFDDPVKSVEDSYNEGVTDEFVTPRVRDGYDGVKNGDLLIFYNFRPDRARQLSKSILLDNKEFGNLFDRGEKTRPKNITLITMTNYDPKLKRAKPLLGREYVSNTLSNVLEKNSIRQLRIAETEKYAHVTYFFNGLVEKPRRFEDRIMVPSLKIGTYDKQPEMSARAIAENAVREIHGGKYGFILINFANSDMVGHSGDVPATIKAVETVDECLGQVYEAWKNSDQKATLIVTADHGNAEKLFDQETGQPHTAHTSNPVPFIIVSKKWQVADKKDGGLKDVAPTILEIIGLTKPRAMNGQTLAKGKLER